MSKLEVISKSKRILIYLHIDLHLELRPRTTYGRPMEPSYPKVHLWKEFSRRSDLEDRQKTQESSIFEVRSRYMRYATKSLPLSDGEKLEMRRKENHPLKDQNEISRASLHLKVDLCRKEIAGRLEDASHFENDHLDRQKERE